jgi:hypothetical protein
LGLQGVSIDFVILADYAQAVSGKLTLVGAGWNLHHAKQYPSTVLIGLGLGFLVPWPETNRKHHFEFVIRGSEGPELVRGGGELEIGREAGTPVGMTQRVSIGITAPLNVPQPGSYEVVVTVEGDEKRVGFEALTPQT